MSCVLELLRARFWPRAATLALLILGVGGCSSDSSRFAENPFASSRSNAEITGSIPPAQAAPTGRVESQPLPLHSGQTATSQSASDGSGITGGGRGTPSYSLASHRPNAVPSSSLPRVGAATSSRLGSSTHRPASAPAMNQATSPGVHVVAPGENLSKIARRYGKPVGDIAKANNMQASAALKAGDRLVIPGVRASAAKSNGPPAKAPAGAAQPKAAAASGAAETAPTATLFAPVTETGSTSEGGKAADAGAALPKFRWPANGRVIASYGPTNGGQQNDGINIALPENTPIKAAEDGVVAYAGNELKGYGNLVLVRHPNGYVTAYAHAKELLVKRGDPIKRGQVIARSGQSGNVNAPQLHFEIRKGASPLDPMKFLGG
jgi:murein DD-endopeptidase MepM/ murein hydrolase activator NlpD